MTVIRALIIATVLLITPATYLFAQEGPFVPCVGCESLDQTPFPETGAWYNPDQSGSGFSLEFQNGVMVAMYFGYDLNGEPEWTLFTGRLERSEKPGVMWELKVEPDRFTGGNCLGCPYQVPKAPVKQAAILIEFLQRAYARLTLSDGSIQYLVPIIYGDAAIAYFAEQTPWRFPQLIPTPNASLWVLAFKDFSAEEFAPWTWSSNIYMIGEGSMQTSGPFKGMLDYDVSLPGHPPEVAMHIGDILCGLELKLGEPGCMLQFDEDNQFIISIANFTDTRFFGERKDGNTVQGIRLKYD